ncbi:hypothetical protein BT96DRAFT_984277 [Gymnopus androsaceus JB14]|uniref:Uncharacterized protein n=1 Tax=Gymnopus androsaceus JB14 TaxID=1447944 RepID=A0A6A4INI6_9AGAR|nr:hypothetical protein BT96DRAFT_984277 [Gymnopus androsaceus JB14]
MPHIYKLPQEMLGEIFRHICCGDTGVNRISNDDDAEDQLPTLRLSRVCTRWYRLVTLMPTLWSSFRSQALNSPSTPSLFNMFLERSHLHPIDFIVKDNCSSRSHTGFLSSLTMIENPNRWHHVRIAANSSFVEKILRPLIHGGQSLPGLVSLNLQSSINAEISFPMNCPNLGSLMVDTVDLNLVRPRPSISHLTLVDLNPLEAARVIMHCPNLQALEVRSSMLEQSQHRVTHFTLRFMPFTSEELLHLFLHVPLLAVEELPELHHNRREEFGEQPNNSDCSGEDIDEFEDSDVDDREDEEKLDKGH